MSQPLASTCPHCSAELQRRGLSAFLLRACPSCGVHVRARRAIDRFDLREQLAASGLGILVRARDRESGAEYAVKLLHPPCGTQPEDLEGFLTIGRTVMALDHPHIAHVAAVGVEDGVVFVAREWMRGESLAVRLAEGGGMPEAEVLTLAVQAASALRAAHAQGLLHRDLRTANFIFADAQTVKITDFGQAILYDCASEVACIVWGSPCYNSPERMRFMPEDARSDIYALGAILCHALTGQPPYEGEVQGDVLFERLEHEVTRVEALLPTVRPMTAAVLNRMLAADANDRPQSWEETIELLTQARAAVPIPLAAPRPPSRALVESAPRATGTVRSSATAGSWATIAMLIMLCGAVGYAGWQWWRWPATHPAPAPTPKKHTVIVAQSTPPAQDISPPAIALATPPVETPATPPSPAPPAPAPPAPAATPSLPITPTPPPPATPAPAIAPQIPPAPPPPVILASIASKPPPPPPLFDFNGWTTAKLSKPNAPPVVGEATPLADKGALRIAGNTDGVTGKNDTVVFHHRELEGDWTLVAHVAAISGGVAGIMVREKVALSCWCLAATIAEDGSIIVRTREHAETPAVLTTPLPSPKQGWLEMVRRGPSLIVAHSADGKTWRVLSTLAPPGMGARVPVGFFASGATATGSATATFDHLSLKLGK